jgi:hypothetical protein
MSEYMSHSFDTMFDLDWFIRLFTFAVFVLTGFDLAKSVPQPKTLASWFVVGLVAFMTGFSGFCVPDIHVLGYEICLNMVLMGVACGFVIGFVLRMYPRVKMH